MYIVADIGGTKMRIAGSRDLETFDDPVILDTPQAYEKGLELFIQTARAIAAGEAITAVSVGFPGTLSKDKRSIFDAANIPEWKGHEIVLPIETALGTRVYVENDAALVGLGEAVYGAGMGSPIMMYLTVSTGVNAVRIIDHTIDRGTYGFEVGEQCFLVNDTMQYLGDLISGSAISKKYGMQPRELGKESLVWEELARLTALGLYNSIVHWSPDRIVVGGSMFNEIGISVERVREYVASFNRRYPELPEIVHSGLGDVGGLFGGLALLTQKK